VPERLELAPFFLDAHSRRLFAVFTAPRKENPAETAVLFCPPFGEEIAKSRLTVATQARAFAAHGIATLRVDLSCTGDSEGEFADASWDDWLGDVEAAARWLVEHGAERVVVWGLRLGALLAMDWLRRTDQAVFATVLWQPVFSGRQFLRQFLRMRTVADTVAGETKSTVNELLEELQSGRMLEVGGYALSPKLAEQLDAADAGGIWHSDMPPLALFEVINEHGQGLMPATAKSMSQAQALGLSIATHLIVDKQFWRSTDIVLSPNLIAETTKHALPT